MPILTGSDYARDIRILAHSTRLPIDLTGFDLQLVIKAKRGDPVELLTLSLGAGLAVAVPTNGTITMTLDAAQTDLIGAGDRVWGLYRIDGGRRLALATGKLRVLVGV